MSAAAYCNGLPFDAAGGLLIGGTAGVQPPQASTPLGPVQIDHTDAVASVAWGSQAAPLSTIAGLTFDAAGNLVVVNFASLASPVSQVNGLTVDANGALVKVAEGSQSGTLTFNAGMAFDANGSLLTSS